MGRPEQKKLKVCDDRRINGHVNLDLNIFVLLPQTDKMNQRTTESRTCGFSPKTINGAYLISINDACLIIKHIFLFVLSVHFKISLLEVNICDKRLQLFQSKCVTAQTFTFFFKKKKKKEKEKRSVFSLGHDAYI